ncbi:hypothetical protein Q5H92_13790 [Hymenobacter sp. M29]|uniref:Uncharacterized protein n=1 Tax=Hymenobacter mellowenesis TaxID=3063995 RepID=A0ABT9AC59_9BACT|nr:hypothetical protein [Hymenobacter sp. M29]MDO7847437.1 hypothetical protein [Hymenobacter sp. M29]
MHYLPHISKAGVNYGRTTDGTHQFAYRLFNDTWLEAELTEEQLRSFVRKHKLAEIEGLDFTHLLKMDGHTIECL